MSFKKFIVIPVIIAALAALLQVTDQLIGQTSFFSRWNGFGWLSFQAWALYFLGGGTVKGGVRVLLAYIAGMVGSILIMAFGGCLDGAGLGFWAMPLSLLIIVIPVICLERVPWFDFIPALFIGAGAFFAIMSYVPETTFCRAFAVELTYCVIGLIFGYVTVWLRTRYEKRVTEK